MAKAKKKKEAKTPEKRVFSAGRVRGKDGKLTFPSKLNRK